LQTVILIPKNLQSKISELESEGKTVVTVFLEDKIIGVIAVADIIRENAKNIVKQLYLLIGKEITLLGVDNERTVKAIAKKLDNKCFFRRCHLKEK